MKQTSLPGFGEDDADSPKGESSEGGFESADLLECGDLSPLSVEKKSDDESPHSKDKTVWVIDAHSLIHQVFHALPEMTSPRGEPVGAVFGFTRDLLYLLEEKKPDYLFCAFDLPGPTFRHAMYDQYKIQRAAMPDDLQPQIPAIRRVIAALGIPALACDGFEADDILATVARAAEERGDQCFLVTADKDCRQLISDRIRVFNIRKNETFDRERLQAEWGVAPEQVVDFQALVGDSVDNVPGVPLIGPKFARQLLEQFGALDAVLEHVAEVKGAKRQENLQKFRDQALLSRDLVRLDSHVPIEIDWAAGRPGRVDLDAALALFHDFGFRAVGQKLSAWVKRIGGGRRGAGEKVASGQWSVASEGTGKASGTRAEVTARPQDQRPKTKDQNPPPPAPRLPFTAHLVDAPEAFAAFFDQLRQQKSFSFDTETTSVRPRWAKLVGMSFAWNDHEAWYLPLRSPPGEPHLDEAATLAALKPILEDPAVEKIGQNLKYDMIVLRGAGIEASGVGFDTMVASYLLESGRRNHNLDDLAQNYLGHETIKITELIGRGANQRRMDEVPTRLVADYAGEDAWLPVLLRPVLEKKLVASGQWLVASGEGSRLKVQGSIEKREERREEREAKAEEENLPSPFGRGAGGEGGAEPADLSALTLTLSQRERGPDTNPQSPKTEDRSPKTEDQNPEIPKSRNPPSPAPLLHLLRTLELPLIDVLVEMEWNGIKVDVARLGELNSRYGERMGLLEAEIHKMAGRAINIASPKQLQELLFDELKLPVTKRTAKTGPSTDAEVLEELARLHPLPAKILEYRQYAKLKNTYVDALPELICPETGRVHASFNQVVTATGRLSCNDPNLQNIPVRTDEGREIRSAFVPGREGWSLLAADYSQIELRVLAHYSGDARLCEAFARDEDIHARVASQVNGVPLGEVTSEMRRAAKAVNFGVVYGQGAFGLSRGLGIEQEAAAKFIDSYFEGYPGIEKFLAQVLAECRKKGYVETILGRRRAISGVREGAGRQRNLAERTAVNTVIQGSAADLIKQAMIAIHRRLRTERLSAKMLLQIHDELIFEVPTDQLHHLAELVTEEMVGACTLNVPLKVDVKAGPNWAATEEVN